MDADVLSIETSRSKMELLGDFGRFRYPNDRVEAARRARGPAS